jgi:hypothetical protein
MDETDVTLELWDIHVTLVGVRTAASLLQSSTGCDQGDSSLPTRDARGHAGVFQRRLGHLVGSCVQRKEMIVRLKHSPAIALHGLMVSGSRDSTQRGRLAGDRHVQFHDRDNRPADDLNRRVEALPQASDD